MRNMTIKDIAKTCNVSVATVSKALNHATDISAETAERIRKAARELGYFPNAAARSLKTNRSFNLGILFAEYGILGELIKGQVHEFFVQVINNFQVAVEREGYDVTFITHHIGDTKMSYFEHCKYRNFDGVMIAGVDFDDPEVLELVNSDIPAVTVDHVFDYRSAVTLDNVQGVRDLVHYIYGKGHRKIAFIHGDDVTVTKYRLASFYKTCEELGISVPSEYVRAAHFHDPASCAAATGELLALRDRPTCIMYPDDFAYIGGMEEIEKHGLCIPDDISVVGFDGIYLSQIFRPRLTTVKQDTEKIGIEAAKLLVKAITSPKVYIPTHTIIPAALLEGDSVKQI